MDAWVVGIDLGGTKTALGLISPDNRVVAHRRMPTDADEGPQAVVERIARLIGELESELPAGQKVSAVGICAPGPLDHVNGNLLTLVNVPGLSNTPLRQMLSDRLGLPVRLEHDAKAAALGDFHYGAGKDRNSMVYIVIGTGVGAAIIIDGQLYYGESNSSGEVGHATVNPYGDVCQCGSRGCLETYTSGPWLVRRYKQALEQVGQSAGDQPITGELITQLAAKGDPIASKVMNGAGEALGIAVATMAMTLNIELYVIGGSVSKAGDLLIEPARQTVPRYSFRAVGSRVKVVASALGDDGPILGCGWLARQALASA
ncbi:MAG: ROK family protein [Anaerolineae bacterium]|nr:ROK family protein [Anaerolineae bacterium]